jgi:ABC-type phosphate/phosphonate transport system substrate-binding protein
LQRILARAGVAAEVIDHPAPAPLEDLWRREDQAAVFMCGLPYSRAEPPPLMVAAPVPLPPEFQGLPQYWSEFVVRHDSGLASMADIFGTRIAFTVPGSQSGCVAALTYFMSRYAEHPTPHRRPLFAEVVAPTITPVGALTAVVQGAAEVAPIDAYALRLLQHYRTDLTSLVRTVGRTAATPIPPLVASPAPPGALDALRNAFRDAHRHAAEQTLMAQLQLQGFAQPDPSSYTALRQAAEAARQFWRSHRLADAAHPAFGELLS